MRIKIATDRMKKIQFTLFIFTLICSSLVHSQQLAGGLTEADKSALENIIVEKYYVADSTDYADTVGGSLPKGSITYRIYVDMKPDYTLQLVYGNAKHELRIETSTSFFNNEECGAIVGYNVNYKKINQGSYALDSWITLNSATDRHAGILRADDTDGSIIHKKGLDQADGLTNGNLPVFKPFNIDLMFFKWGKKSSLFSTKNGGWAAISGTKGGTKGPTADNRVLIAKLTTNGTLSFELNIQMGTPGGGILQYVAKNPEGSELTSAALTLK